MTTYESPAEGVPSIEAGPFRLVPLSVADIPEMEALAGDAAVRRETFVPREPSPGFADSWVGRYIDGWKDGTRAGFGIRDADGAFVGFMALVRIDREGAQAEIGYIVAPEARGRGVASSALRGLTRWAIDELDLRRLELRIRDGNEASRRVAEATGYRYEGTLRSTHFKDGERVDLEIWSLLPEDLS